ncbi:MAG: SDR family oxidoreductase [Burkholderiales bacterium]
MFPAQKSTVVSESSVAIVTGAGSGIGRETALALAPKVGTVIAVGRRGDKLLETAVLSDRRIIPLRCNVTMTSDRASLLAMVRKVGRVRYLVHCAGLHLQRPVAEITAPDWEAVMAVNVTARLFLTIELITEFSYGARVLFVGSNSATRARVGGAAYSVSQAASAMLQSCLQAELSPLGFHVGMAVPSPAHTGMIDQQMAVDAARYPDALEYRRIRDAGGLVSPRAAGQFFSWLLTGVTEDEFTRQSWSIRNQEHHAHWLGDQPLYEAPPRR